MKNTSDFRKKERRVLERRKIQNPVNDNRRIGSDRRKGIDRRKKKIITQIC